MFWSNDNSMGEIQYCQPTNKFNSDMVAGFDLDWTIICPKTGKKFPESIDDWKFAFDIGKIKEYSVRGYKIVIFTNQKGSFQGSGGINFEEFKTRWLKIFDNLGVPAYILASTHNDFSRKPSIGMWNFMEKNLNNDIKIDKKKSFYVGDAAGRSNDHSDCDIKFAINLDLHFMTPEEFFQGSNKFNFENLKNNLKGLNPKKYLEDVEKFKKNNGNLINKLVKDLELTPSIRVIIMTGSPASGKTTLVRQVVKKAVKNDFARNWTIYSLDIEGTKSKLKKKLITPFLI
jgi:bifunctional polynucleotide phosphatase/kinase